MGQASKSLVRHTPTPDWEDQSSIKNPTATSRSSPSRLSIPTRLTIFPELRFKREVG
jgi:hypothetical protein